MKVLLVANMYPSKKYPHYGVFIKNIEDILINMDNVQIKRVVMKKIDNIFLKVISYIVFYIKIIFYSSFGNFDVFYGHFISHIAIPIIILRKINKKIKIIVNAHGNDIVPDREKDFKWVSLVKKALSKSDYIIVPSEYFKCILINEYNISKDIIFIFPSGGIDRKVFFKKNKTEILEKYKFDPTKKYIGYVSRIERNKGWDVFLKMIKIFKDNNENEFKFIIVGDGDEIDQFDEMATELEIENQIIRFKLLSQNEISDLFNIFDFFCFPTYRKSESLGLVGIEAMACETLVISSDKYGPSTYMKNGVNGFTFHSEDSNDLYYRIKHLFTLTEEEKNKIINNALKTVEIYDKENVSRLLIDIFEKKI